MGCRKICAALCGVQLQPGLGAAGFIAGISPLARLASQEAVQSCQPRLAVRGLGVSCWQLKQVLVRLAQERWHPPRLSLLDLLVVAS